LNISNVDVPIDNGEYFAKVNTFHKGILTVFYASIGLYAKGKFFFLKLLKIYFLKEPCCIIILVL